MAKYQKKVIHSFNGCFLSEQSFHTISLLFEDLKLKYAQCECSELINLHNYTIKRNKIKIKKYLLAKQHTSFIFVHCLN